MLSAICFNLDQSKVLSSGNGLKDNVNANINNKQERNCCQQFYISFVFESSTKRQNIRHNIIKV